MYTPALQRGLALGFAVLITLVTLGSIEHLSRHEDRAAAVQLAMRSAARA